MLKNADAIRSYNQQSIGLLETFANHLLNEEVVDVGLKQQLSRFISDLHTSNFSLFATSNHLQKGLELFGMILEKCASAGLDDPRDNVETNSTDQLS